MPADPSLDLVARVRAMAAAHPYGFLATTAADGSTNVRLVQHVRVDEDLTVWIGTSPSTRKVAEVRRRPACAYAIEDRHGFAAATLRGAATIETDDASRTSTWAPGFEAFFPEGPGGEDFVVLRVATVDVELIDFTNGIHPDPYGLASQRYQRSPSGWSAVVGRELKTRPPY